MTAVGTGGCGSTEGPGAALGLEVTVEIGPEGWMGVSWQRNCRPQAPARELVSQVQGLLAEVWGPK